jgi:hypothetical protein
MENNQENPVSFDELVSIDNGLTHQDLSSLEQINFATLSAQDVLSKLCELYQKIKRILDILLLLPIPENIKSALRLLMKMLDGICTK